MLIIGAGMHDNTGTGITLKNLFKKFPLEAVCFICSTREAWGAHANGYDNIFVLSGVNKELSISGTSDPGKQAFTEQVVVPDAQRRVNAKKALGAFLRKLLAIMGREDRYYRSTANMQRWLQQQKPTVIYSVGSYSGLCMHISESFHIPIVLHIMDDWISTVLKPGWIWHHRNHVIQRNFRELIAHSKTCLAVSDKMAEEYCHRYGRKWQVFHNPIDVAGWLPTQKKTYLQNSVFKIGYFGRVTNANQEAIDILAKHIEELQGTTGIELHIFSQLPPKTGQGVHYHAFVPHDELPALIPQMDLLLLPFFFDHSWSRFARLSMPTKVSEYMISGVPMLLISDNDNAVYDLLVKNDCAFYLDSKDLGGIYTLLTEILNAPDMRETKARKAVKIAAERFDIDKVATTFMDSIRELG